jgi:hypothetical protein
MSPTTAPHGHRHLFKDVPVATAIEKVVHGEERGGLLVGGLQEMGGVVL